MSGLDLLAIIAERDREIYAQEEGAPKLNKRKQKVAAVEPPEKRRRFMKGRRFDNGPLPELPEDFKAVISCFNGRPESGDVSLILQKKLFATDLSDQNRLSIPMKQIRTPGFLLDSEAKFLKGRNGKNMNKLAVYIVEPNRKKTTANLVRWDMKKANGTVSTSYAIITTWGEIHRRNELKIGTVLQIWSFRVGKRLGFAIVEVPE